MTSKRYSAGSRIAILAMFSFVMVAAAANPAYAQASTVGDMISTLSMNMTSPLSTVITGLAFLAGMALMGTGLMRLAHSGESHKASLPDGMMRIAGGAFLVALPAAMKAGVETFYGSGSGLTTGAGGFTAPSACLAGSSQTVILTCVAQNVALNVVPVFMSVAFGIIFLIGAIWIGHSIYEMAMSHSTGQRQTPKGWTTKMVLGCLVCNLPSLINAIEQTLGITNSSITTSGFVGLSGTTVNSMLAYKSSGNVAILSQYADLISWLFVILALFGVLAIWKGISMLRSFAEGDKQGTVASGMTHIIGGALLANGKFTVCLVVNTLMGQTFGFC